MFYCAPLDLCSWLSPSWNNPFTSPSCLRRCSPTDWKYIDISERCWSFYIWKRVNCQKLSMLSIKFPWYNNTQQYVASKSFQICTFVSHNGNKTSLHRQTQTVWEAFLLVLMVKLQLYITNPIPLQLKRKLNSYVKLKAGNPIIWLSDNLQIQITK